jgi:hypothetical protein
MDQQGREQAVMSAVTTEHFVLQMAANSTVAESGARATLYVMALSSSLVALGFSVDSEQAFVPLAATILPAVFVLGIFTVVRLVATSLQNLLCLGGIVRIHEHYRQLGPEAEAFFGTAGGEAEARATTAMLAIPEPGKLLTGGLFTAAGMMSGINSIVGGAGIRAPGHGDPGRRPRGRCRHPGCAGSRGFHGPVARVHALAPQGAARTIRLVVAGAARGWPALGRPLARAARDETADGVIA